MRDFTKSMMSYTWAMSLFGVQQMLNMFRPSKATESFDNVTDATRDEFGDGMRAAFRAGDNLQRGMVDLTFGIFGLGMVNGRGNNNGCGVSDMGRRSGDFVRDTVNAAGQAADALGSMTQGAASYAADATRRGAGGRGGRYDTDQRERSYGRGRDRGYDRSYERCYDRSCGGGCGRNHDRGQEQGYDRSQDRSYDRSQERSYTRDDEGRFADHRHGHYRESSYDRGVRAASDAGRQAADAVGQGVRAMGDAADAMGRTMEASADAAADSLSGGQSSNRGSSAGQTQSWGSPARGSDRSKKS